MLACRGGATGPPQSAVAVLECHGCTHTTSSDITAQALTPLHDNSVSSDSISVSSDNLITETGLWRSLGHSLRSQRRAVSPTQRRVISMTMVVHSVTTLHPSSSLPTGPPPGGWRHGREPILYMCRARLVLHFPSFRSRLLQNTSTTHLLGLRCPSISAC